MIHKQKIEEAGIKGFIEVEVPKYKERMKILKDSGLMVDEEKATIEQLDNFDKIVDLIKKYIRKVQVKVNGVDIIEFEELEYYSAFMPIVTKISQLVFNGITLSEDLKKS